MNNKILGIPKIIFVDFDNTLSANVWADNLTSHSFSSDNHTNWESMRKMNPDFYALCKPVPCVARAIQFFHQRGSRIFLLSHETGHFARKLKEQWVEHYFPGIFEDKIFTASADQKLKVMDVYSLTESIDRKEIALIEDRASTCDQADKEGFISWTLAFIALTFDSEVILSVH